MIVVAGGVPLQPGKRARAEALVAEVERLTRPEPGCISYTFFFAAGDPNWLQVFEQWESQEALSAHLEKEHTQRFLAGIGEVAAAPPDVKKYEVSSVSPLF